MDPSISKILPRRWQLKVCIDELTRLLEVGTGRTHKPLSKQRRRAIEREREKLRAELIALNPPSNLRLADRFSILTPAAGVIGSGSSQEEAFERAQELANSRGLPVHVVDSLRKSTQVHIVAPQVVRS